MQLSKKNKHYYFLSYGSCINKKRDPHEAGGGVG